MPIFTPENAELLAGQREGYGVLERNTADQGRNVRRMMDRYGTANADYLDKMGQAQLRAEGEAKLQLDARLASSQLRYRMHEYKLRMLKDAYKRQAKGQKAAMWAAALGSAGAIAPGVVGLFSQGPRGGGPVEGEFYTDLSGNMRQQLD